MELCAVGKQCFGHYTWTRPNCRYIPHMHHLAVCVVKAMYTSTTLVKRVLASG